MTTSILLMIHSLLMLFCIIKILILEHKYQQMGKDICTIIEMIRKAAKTEDDKEDIIDESN